MMPLLPALGMIKSKQIKPQQLLGPGPYLVLHKGVLIAARRLQDAAIARTALRWPRRRASRRALEDLHELLAHFARCLVITARAGPSTEVLLRALLGRSASPFPAQRRVSATAGSSEVTWPGSKQ